MLQEKAGDTKRDEAQAVAKPLKKLILEKCADLEDKLEQIADDKLMEDDDQQITRACINWRDGSYD